MAKSPTKRKSKSNKSIPAVSPDVIKEKIDETVKYIVNWERQELLSLVSNPTPELPICIPISKNAYVIGNCGVKKESNISWVVDHRLSGVQERFIDKRSAVVYAICCQSHWEKLAQQILSHNKDLHKMYSNLEEFKHLQDNARRKRDYWRLDYFTIMAENVQYAIVDARNQLEKSLNLAKYFRIWE